ncbi:B12-binding domain-containing radical SAM protein [Planctomycetota bacterium]
MNPKLQLIRCPVDDQSVAADQWNMPLDLLVVGGAVDPRCDLEIIDGTLLGLDGVREKIDPSAACVGFTYTALSARSLSVLAAECKDNGSVVIVGGQPATAAAGSLVKEEVIDAVCVGDGQPTMRILSQQLLRGRVDLSGVPNVLLQEEGRQLRSASQAEDVWRQVLPERHLGGLTPADYLGRYPDTNTLINMTGSRALNIYSKRGCPHHCSFCARQDKRLRLRDPEGVAAEIASLVSAYGIDYVLDTSDTWLHRRWATGFADARRQRGVSHIGMMVFADAREIDHKACQLMDACGVDSVLLGIESGSERVLARNGKAMTRRRIFKAVDDLVNAGIRVSCSFVLGLIGEDDHSLEETVALAAQLHKRPGVLCYGNVIMPLAGSRLWSEAFPGHRSWPSCITRAFDYDLELVRELYVATATHIHGGLEALRDACGRLLRTSRLPAKEYAR